MELRHLRYFTAVAETGSLSAAAEKLFIAQPPLSTQIRQLEEELGVALFTRHSKGVLLTAAGKALLPEARALLKSVARLGDVARGSKEGEGGSIRVGLVPSATGTVLPDLARELRKLHPQLNLQVREMVSAQQIEALLGGDIDVGIARTPARHPRIVVACQITDAVCLALPADDQRSDRPSLDLRHFAEDHFVAFTRHPWPAYFDQTIHLCTEAGFSPSIRYEASTVHGVLDLVGAGLGVALVPASSAMLAMKRVTLRPLRKQPRYDVLTLLRRKVDGNPLLPEVEVATRSIFNELQRGVAQALTRSGRRERVVPSSLDRP